MLHEVGVERQNHERQVGIDHADVHRQVGIEDLQRRVDQAQPHQEGIEQTVVAENAHPRVDANQDRGPGRHHDQQQQHGLQILAGTGDGVGHRVADQQAQRGADERHFQRTQVRRNVQVITTEQGVVGEIQGHLQLFVGVTEDLGVRRDRDIGFGEADLEHNQKRQGKEQEQPEERHADDHLPPGGLYALESALDLAYFHERSTTPLSSSHQT
ncbi:hypothetical protein ALP75_201467 [Pseudomonas syringae pv. actinidiae]|nr:hypothetical protein ALP75_201467 [Pseudomonas syringae pv. actinidiae]